MERKKKHSKTELSIELNSHFWIFSRSYVMNERLLQVLRSIWTSEKIIIRIEYVYACSCCCCLDFFFFLWFWFGIRKGDDKGPFDFRNHFHVYSLGFPFCHTVCLLLILNGLRRKRRENSLATFVCSIGIGTVSLLQTHTYSVFLLLLVLLLLLLLLTVHRFTTVLCLPYLKRWEWNRFFFSEYALVFFFSYFTSLLSSCTKLLSDNRFNTLSTFLYLCFCRVKYQIE